MKKSKIIYLFNIILLIFTCLYVKNYHYESIYSNETKITGVITKITKKDNNVKIILNAKEKVLVSCFDCDFNYNVGDEIEFFGYFQDINVNANFNLFNYEKYLKSLKIYKNFIFTNHKYIKSSNNILAKTYNNLNKKIESYKSSYFLKAMILGDTTYLDNYDDYKINGIVHLFAISGLHVSIISSILVFIFRKIFKLNNFAYIIIYPILIFYMLLINSASIIRSVLMYISISLTRVFKFKISSINILYYLVVINILINPHIIYNMGFQLSYVITFFLILSNKKLKKVKNYFLKLFLISVISFFSSLPIIINSNFEFNLLTPLINLIIVPLVSSIIFPISLLTLIFPFLDNVLTFLLNGFNTLNDFFSSISIIINVKHLSIYLIIFYYLIFLAFIFKSKHIYLLLIYLVFLICLKYININSYLLMMDVKQGDAILIKNYFGENILLDAGSTESSSKNVIIPYLKSIGINKIDRFIISHGDKDHIAGAMDIIKTFKVNNIYLNSYKDSNYEKEISEFTYINRINKNTYLNEHIYILNYPNKDENDDSLITYLTDYKVLCMADASSLVEEKIDLSNINILKVGHHGSKTSSSKEFIDKVKPKLSLISVGLKNKYNHPDQITLENLKDSFVLMTSLKGMIKVNLKTLNYETYY